MRNWIFSIFWSTIFIGSLNFPFLTSLKNYFSISNKGHQIMLRFYFQRCPKICFWTPLTNISIKPAIICLNSRLTVSIKWQRKSSSWACHSQEGFAKNWKSFLLLVFYKWRDECMEWVSVLCRVLALLTG